MFDEMLTAVLAFSAALASPSMKNFAARSKTLRIPPYHLFEYTPRTLRRMIASAGFEMRELQQSAVPIQKMGLRGTVIENAGKVSLQLIAHLSSRLLNRGGDRLQAVAVRS